MLGIVLEWIYPLDSGWKFSLWVFEKHQFLISPCMFFKVKIMACEKFLRFGDVQRAWKRHFETSKFKGETVISQCIWIAVNINFLRLLAVRSNGVSYSVFWLSSKLSVLTKEEGSWKWEETKSRSCLSSQTLKWKARLLQGKAELCYCLAGCWGKLGANITKECLFTAGLQVALWRNFCTKIQAIWPSLRHLHRVLFNISI